MTKFKIKNIDLISLLLISLISIIGTMVYYIYSLDLLGLILSLILIIPIFSIILIKTKDKSKTTKTEENKLNHKDVLYIFLYLLNYFYLIFILLKAQTADAVISPWEKIPAHFFVFYFTSLLILTILILKKIKFSLVFILMQYFVSFSACLLVYKIAYGFDPFVHEATIKLINEKGVVLPKPFYYIGQYSLIIIIHKITSVSIDLLNKGLTPFLSAIFIPLISYRYLKNYFKNKKINLLSIVLLLIIPYPYFILSVPQNLSYLFLIITILLGLLAKRPKDLIIIFLTALFTFFIHPFSGIPAILFLLSISFCLLKKEKGSYVEKFINVKIFYSAIFLISSFTLPAFFYFFNSKKINSLKNINLSQIVPSPTMPGQENFILNFIYLVEKNIFFIIIGLALAGIIITLKNKDKFKNHFLTLFLSGAFLLSYIITKLFISFNFLISYEQNNYPQRILIITLIFLFPFMLISLRDLTRKLIHQNIRIKIVLGLFLLLTITVSLYISYPRLDNYHNSHGYSVSQNDINAVNLIDKKTQNDYIVLTNQQTSAAALREFGFDHYYKENIYFYPIPTSGKLYQYYLDMVYKYPSRKTVEEAMNFAGVNEAYFVLSKYWWAFDKIKEEAKIEADSWEVIGNEDIYIFKYTK